uniref:Ribosome biogenesis protein NOP53 n=1 Tax=Gongylonema pulchrum TaxID=637853 RepID=A0A183DHM5_9BILA
LPSEEAGRKRKTEPVVLPEDVVAFTEKTAAVKKKAKDSPIEFKKRKTMMKIRQRTGDD